MVFTRPLSRVAFTLVTVVTGFALCLGPLQPALAQTIENPVPIVAPTPLQVSIAGNLPEAANNTYRNIYTELTRAGVVALTNALQLFLGQMAYDAAEYIATGGKGQGKLFFDGKVGEYLQNVGSDAAGEFMASLSDSNFFKGIGFNLCQPSDPTTLLRLQVSLGDLGSQLFPTTPNLNLPGMGVESRFNRPRPRCEFQAVLDNYDTLFRTMSDGDVVRNLERSFDPGLSQLGTMTNVYNRFLTDVQRQVTDAAAQRVEGRGFRPVESMISGNVRTPASVVEAATNEQVVRKPGADQSMIVGTMLQNAWQAGPIQLAMYTGSIFLNTLASKFMQRIFEKGLGGGFTPSSPLNLSGPDSVAVYGKTDARNANIDLKNPPPQQSAEYDVVSQMQTCLPSQRGAWNCVMDQSLVQAVRSKTEEGGVTVREAMERDMLHGKWRLIPETRTRENQDPQCYTQGYCSGNLQKMRLVRILPIGFELAANSETNQRRCDTADGCVTLDEVVKGFSSCNDQGAYDAVHPWCHMIDPNWVITSFPQQCTLSGYTDTLVSSKLPIRKEECQDVQTCLARNDRGECTGGYGYCMAERSVYRFNADVCPAHAASCRIYTDAANKKIGYLRNTIDRAACDASNAGCLWYANRRVTNASETAEWAANTSTGERVYFKASTPNQTATTKGLDTCPASEEGCTRLYAFTPGKAALNLMINGSFEAIDPTTSTDALGWRKTSLMTFPPVVFGETPALMVADLGTPAFLGDKAAKLSYAPALSLTQSVEVVGGRSYSFSFYARSAGGAAAMSARVYPSTAPHTIEGIAIADISRPYRSPGLGINLGPAYEVSLSTQLSQDWQRFEYSLVLPASSTHAHFFITGNNLLVDAVQFEEGEFATQFVDTFTSGLQATFMKIAPEELQCTKPASDTTRSPLCNAFAQSCNQLDAGCQGYTDKEGGEEIPAILSDNDLCPAVCVGYSEYRKAASSFDLVKDVDPRFSDPEEPTSTHFIPRTAGQCTQQDVGCEAFTLVDDTGRADGAAAAYSYIRACEKPGADSETYFTWEGADTVGYQLRTWSLKKDTGPFDLGPRILAKIQADQLSFKEPDTCNEASWKTAADPDCRQFYDALGRIFYRYFSQTVLSTNDCTNLRLGRSNRADCERTGGRLNDRAECTYGAYLPQSRSCKANATSCRMFTGANSGDTKSVLRQSFRETVAPFEQAGVTTSTEALLVGDVSLRVGDPGGLSAPLGFARGRTVFNSEETSLYRATFWAKVPATSTTLVVRTSRAEGGGEAVVGSVTLTPEWQRFTVGLFEGAPNSSSTIVTFTAPMVRGAGFGFYLDEVSIVRVQDVVYVRNNTWNTPAQCDQGLDGADEPQAMLNCKAYTNRQGYSVNAHRFTRLCRETSIGCTAFVDSRNTDETYEQRFVQPNPIDPQRYPPTTIVRPADRYVYLIDDPDKRCNKENMSCRAFGKPKLQPDRQFLDFEKPFETVFYKDDVTRYKTALCKPSEAYCAEYKYGSTKEYFRDPGTSLCEYREAQILTDGSGPPQTQLAGWYVKGSAETPCYSTILEGGNAYGIARSGDSSYKGYAGTCEEAAGECTELRDINDTSDPTQRSGKSYFYIKNEGLDTASCNGTVDLGRGCVLFRDMSSGALNYNARASYEKYKATGYKPATPVDCRNNPENPLCNQPGRCRGVRSTIVRSPRGAPTTVHASESVAMDIAFTNEPWVGASECRTDDDCRVPATDGPVFPYRVYTGPSAFETRTTSTNSVVVNAACDMVSPERSNDSNLLLKVSVDRECSQWLGCRSSETVLDPSTNKYVEICSVPALCDKATGQAGDQFCASYVNRATSTTEPILNQGAMLDAAQYASRYLGLGQKDYSGYTIPNAFQVMDLQSVRVAIDGAKNVPDAPFRLSQDYRLTAAVLMPPTRAVSVSSTTRYVHTVRPNKYQAKILGEYTEPGTSSKADPSDGLLIANPQLTLCKHMGSGRIGYFRPADLGTTAPAYCYLPVHSNSDLLDFQNVAEKFSLADPTTNNFLTQAYPPAECRAHPEQDSPFPASFTTEWDMTRNPIRPLRRLSGFATANGCEFGEDCSCTYKRVEYEGSVVPKFYNQFSNASPPGLCVGGPRDGQACIPSKIFSAQGGNGGGQASLGGTPTLPSNDGAASGARSNAIESANSEQLCGPPEMGGRCMPFKSVTVVRGIFGNCLERDLSRLIGKTQGSNPCLTWNPTLLLNGDKDPYHYNQTAGYMPPQNSGKYYCLSDARKPKTVNLDVSFFATTTANKYSGAISELAFDDRYVSNGSGGSGGNFSGSSIDGVAPNGSTVSDQCEYTDDDQDDSGSIGLTDVANQKDFNALRLINTGRGVTKQYTESFFKIAPAAFAKGYYDRAETGDEAQKLAISDNAIGYVGLTAIRSPNSTGRLACGYNQDWVDGITTPDYDEVDQMHNADVQWQQKFNAGFDGVLTRSSEDLMTLSTDASTVVKANCVDTLPSYRGKQCFFKTWETGYQTIPEDNKLKFVGLYGQPQTDGTITNPQPPSPQRRNFEQLRTAPFYGKCDSTKPYFSIRAVFQSQTDDMRPAVPRNEMSGMSTNWTLAGFWVTACGGVGSDEHYIYMYPRVEYGDVCRQLAEVVSRNSNQDAAFTDRVWKDGNFTIPILGISYNARYSPFSSALNTRAPGRDPLFQTGQEIVGYSPLNPPTFLAAGYRTYFTQDKPQDKWAYLTNIFARVYRIYNYYENAVDNGQKACLGDGPTKGKACVPDTLTGTRSKACSLNGVCNVNRIALSGASELSAKRCNGLSGLNAGLVCPPSDVEACHTAPIQISNEGQMTLRQLPCLTTQGWVRDGGGWINTAAATRTTVDQPTAAVQGAFRCAPTPASLLRDGTDPIWREYAAINWDSSVQSGLLGAKCTNPTDQSGSFMAPSSECPERIINNLQIAQPSGAPPATSPHVRRITAAGTGRMTATCERTAGAPLTSPGKCRVFVPSYSIETASSTFEMPQLDINPRDGYQYGECYSDSECAFTQSNFWSAEHNSGSNISISAASIIPTNSCRDYAIVPCADWQLHARAAGVTPPTDAQCRGLVSAGGVLGSGAMWTCATFNPSTENAQVPAPYANRPIRYPGADAIQIAFPPGGGLDRFAQSNIRPAYLIGACVTPGRSSGVSNTAGACEGGLKDGMPCSTSRIATQPNADCIGAQTDDEENRANVCNVVSARRPGSDPADTTAWVPVEACRIPNGEALRSAGSAPGIGLNNDNNMCTHEQGYLPRPDLCPNPSDEYCGLIAYNVRNPTRSIETDPARNPRPAPLPTDVTLGLHKLGYLLGGSETSAPDAYNATYLPRPPVVAAPDIQNCPTPGKCAVQGLNKMSLNGSSEGSVSVPSAQAKTSLRFYAWAAHNQMPLRSITIDWGDGQRQQINDGKLKNHKPFCGARKECVIASSSPAATGPQEKIESAGLTCNTDNDCPVGGGACKPVGTCREKTNIACATDAQCKDPRVAGDSDTCQIRTMFGNSLDACEENFFEFTHLYTCDGPTTLPLCRTSSYGREAAGRPVASNQRGDVGNNTARCERDPDRVCNPANALTCEPGDRCVANMAPSGGCWDDRVQTCRFTPKVMVVDNWGWCTGECRTTRDSGGAPADERNPDPMRPGPPTALHPYGGCYSATPTGDSDAIRSNLGLNDKFVNECTASYPSDGESALRPWVVYQGSVSLRSAR